MTKFDMAQYLEQIGFSLLRQKGHPIYSDGISRIVLPSSGGELNWRLEKKITNDIKKALRLRDANRHVGYAVHMSERLERDTDPKAMALKYIREHTPQAGTPADKPITPAPPAQPPLTATMAEIIVAQTKESEIVKSSNLPKVLRRFDLETRKRLRDKLVDLKSQGHNPKEIADILTKEGFTTPYGKVISNIFVANQMRSTEIQRGIRVAARKTGRFQRANELKKAQALVPAPEPAAPPAPPPAPAPASKPLPPLKPDSELIAHASLIMDSGLFEPEEKLRMLEVIMRKIKK